MTRRQGPPLAPATGAYLRNGPVGGRRPEAAEALGHLGHSSSIDPLLEALEDADPRVRISAIRGLAEIGGGEVQEILFWYFADTFDPLTFPTLVDVLGDMRDHRVVKPALRRLGHFRSPAVKLQLLNSICRCLGARGNFYGTLSLDDTDRPTAVMRLLNRTAAHFRDSRNLEFGVREELGRALRELGNAYEDEDLEGLKGAAGRVAELVRDHLRATGQRPREVLSVFVVVLAIDDFLTAEDPTGLGAAEEIFLAVCIHRLSEVVFRLER